MGTFLKIALPAALALLIAGCASLGLARLETGKSTEADVRREMGAPARVFSDPDGSRQLAFTTGPEGTQTFMAFIAPDGRLARLEQVLTDDQFMRIGRGTMTQDQLERLIGPPWRKVEFANKRQVAWDYVFRDGWGYKVDYSVMIDERGIVVETVHARRETGGNTLR